MPEDEDEDWHDRINRMEDESKNAHFREKDQKELAERLRATGKKVHVCPSCAEVFACEDL